MENASAKIANLAFYRFVDISEPDDFKNDVRARCQSLNLKGTVLLAPEGINGMLAGTPEKMESFAAWLKTDARFAATLLKWSFSTTLPFKRLLVKVKKEIVTLRCLGLDLGARAPSLNALEFNLKLQNSRLQNGPGDFVLLDVRNDFEVRYGTFPGAINPQTRSFADFPKFVNEKLNLPRDREIITFCTGGIRCEKATAVLRQAGYENVFQLEGGILEYLARTTGDFFEGACFVFDEREALDKTLQPTGQTIGEKAAQSGTQP